MLVSKIEILIKVSSEFLYLIDVEQAQITVGSLIGRDLIDSFGKEGTELFIESFTLSVSEAIHIYQNALDRIFQDFVFGFEQ
jgi:hypothetical protein